VATTQDRLSRRRDGCRGSVVCVESLPQCLTHPCRMESKRAESFAVAARGAGKDALGDSVGIELNPFHQRPRYLDETATRVARRGLMMLQGRADVRDPPFGPDRINTVIA
jgi:hypothetical protein